MKETYLEWKRIEGTEDLEISNFGDVRSTTGFMFKATRASTGYYGLGIKINGVQKRVQVHILVAKAFIPNPENKPFVNHKNGDKGNNCVWNLEWVTPLENSLHNVFVLGHSMDGERNPMFGMRGEKSPSFKDYVLAVDDDMNIVGRYATQTEAAVKLLGKYSRAHIISRSLRHDHNCIKSFGYWWMYEKEYQKAKEADLKPRELLEHPEMWVTHYRGQSAAKPKHAKY